VAGGINNVIIVIKAIAINISLFSLDHAATCWTPHGLILKGQIQCLILRSDRTLSRFTSARSWLVKATAAVLVVTWTSFLI